MKPPLLQTAKLVFREIFPGQETRSQRQRRQKEDSMADHSQNGFRTNDFGSSTLRLKLGLAEMLKGGVIMDVMNVAQAEIAEEAGAISVMALERVPAMIRAEGGVARMASPKLIKQIMAAVTIPVMAKARIGHFAEAQVLQSIGVDFIDESEVLTPADEMYHIDKHAFTTPFVCGARNLGEALRRISEGAALIRTKGEPGTGDVVHAVSTCARSSARSKLSPSSATRSFTTPPRSTARPTNWSAW